MSSPLYVQGMMRPKETWNEIIANWSRSDENKFLDYQLGILRTVFPTVEELNRHKGELQDAIVAGFDATEREVYYMDIPRRSRNTPDKYDPAREVKKKLQTKIRSAVTKITNIIRSSPPRSSGTTSAAPGAYGIPVYQQELTTPRTLPPSPELRTIPIEDITIGNVIGEGSYGTVFMGSWRHAKVAIKRLKSPATNDIEKNIQHRTNFVREATTMAKVCCHNNLVQFIGIACDAVTDNLYFLTGYCSGGSLYTLLFEKRLPVSLYDLSRMAVEAAAGILHLHNECIIHRDIASRNILLDGPTRTVKVSDFGFARECADESGGSTSTTIGPVKWMAPESIRKLEYSVYSDVFSFGVLLYEMFQLEQPWIDVAPLRVIDRVCYNNERCTINEAKVPALIVNLIRSCWNGEVSNRPSMNYVIEKLQQYAVSVGHEVDEFASPAMRTNGLLVDNYAYMMKRDDYSRGYDAFFENYEKS